MEPKERLIAAFIEGKSLNLLRLYGGCMDFSQKGEFWHHGSVTISVSFMSLDDYRVSKVEELAKLYMNDFTLAYATVVSAAETIPLQVNNEIKDAFTHVARILTLEMPSKKDVDVEFSKARNHINRAIRDCYKLAYITEHDRFKVNRGDSVLRYGRLDPVFVKREREIERRRKKIFQKEARSHDIANEMANLYGDLYELNEEIENHYGLRGETGEWGRRLRRAWVWIKNVGYWILILIGAIIGFALRPFLETLMNPIAKIIMQYINWI